MCGCSQASCVCTGLSGTLPSQLGRRTQLETLDLKDNLLSGAVPTELGLLEQLNNVTLSYNYFSGAVPTQLGSLDRLELLELGRPLRRNDVGATS